MNKHLHESGMTYYKHLGHSIKQSNRLIIIAIKSYIHGFLPWLYPADGPIGVYQIYREIKKLHHIQRIFKKHDQT